MDSNILFLQACIEDSTRYIEKALVNGWYCKHQADASTFIQDYQPPFEPDMEMIYFIWHLHWLMEANGILNKSTEFNPLHKDLEEIEFHKNSILNIASRYRKDLIEAFIK